MKDSNSSKLRPIDAFVKYFLDAKPYHTKILEVIERYKFAETVTAEFTDSLFSKITYRNNPLCKAVGFGLIFDECGFSNDNCCDLFQCLGGYGVIWDNSDLVGVHQILALNQTTDEIEVAGDFTFDRRLEILKVEEDSLTLRGDRTNEFIFHKLFLIAPFNVYSVESAQDNTLSILGDIAAELNTKREIKVNGTAGRDGLYGVASAVYNRASGLTTVTVAGHANFNVNVNGAYIETETQPRNQGFYQIDRAELVNGNTVVFLKTGTTFPVKTASNNGSVQLRTALSAPRRIWLSGTGTEREYRVADAFYDVTNDRTHLVLADRLFEGETYNELRLYGYMTSSGFDNDEECDTPKSTNIHAVIGETLRISLTDLAPYITSTPVYSVAERQPYNYLVTSGDPRNRERVISVLSGPEWLTVDDNGDGTAVIGGVSNWDSARNVPITLRVTNTLGLYGDQTYNLNITDAIPDVILSSAGPDQTQICNDLVLLSPTILGFGVPGEFETHTYLWEQIDNSPERLMIANATSLEAYYEGSREHTIRFWLDKGTPKEQYKDVSVNKTPVAITSFATHVFTSAVSAGSVDVIVLNLPLEKNSATARGGAFEPNLQWTYTPSRLNAKVIYYVIQRKFGNSWNDFLTLVATETFAPVLGGYTYRVVAVLSEDGLAPYRVASNPIHASDNDWTAIPGAAGVSTVNFATDIAPADSEITGYAMITRSLNTLVDNVATTHFSGFGIQSAIEISEFDAIHRSLLTLPQNSSSTSFGNGKSIAIEITNYTVTALGGVVIGEN